MNEQHLKQLGIELRKAREDQGLTLREAGEIIGVSRTRLGEFELSEPEAIKLTAFIRLCELYEVKPEDLINKITEQESEHE